MAAPAPKETRHGPLSRGELIVSSRVLAERWWWSKSAANRFLQELVDRGALGTCRGTPVGQVFSVVKYENYAISTTEVGDTLRDSGGTPVGQVRSRKKRTEIVPYLNGSDPATWMHEAWQTALGNGHPLSLTPARILKYRQMYSEQLQGTPNPRLAWTACLEAVKRDEFKMGKRAYVMPESLLKTAERRSARVDEAVSLIERARGKSTEAVDFAAYHRARQNR